MTVRGITLEVGTIVILALDGTLVYVEDVQPTFASVVALPDQPTERADDRVFTPGRVGGKKISPFSAADRVLAVLDLTERNKQFIGTYEQLRKEHGPHHVQRTPEEEAAMSVRKAGPAPRSERAPKPTRAEKRAQKRASLCATCKQQKGHPNHPSDHEFVPPAVSGTASSTDEGDTPENGAPRHHKTAKATAAGATIYTLVSEDLSAAKAQPRGDKFNDGNRSHRVVLALAALPNKSGSVDDVITALLADGKMPPANPQKVVRRTLNQLCTAEFGGCVTRA